MKIELLNKIKYNVNIIREISLYICVGVIGFTSYTFSLCVLHILYNNELMTEKSAVFLSKYLFYSCNIFCVLVAIIISLVVISLICDIVYLSKQGIE